MPSHSDPSLESLRRALQERGYLNYGMDRMMLRGAGSPFAWIRGALKAGIVSGLFLAVSLLLVLAVQNNPPITSPQEILLLGIYLAVFCCALTLSVELGAGLLGLALREAFRGSGFDPGKVAWGIGGLAALATALYLSFWWGGREEGSLALGTRLVVLAFILLLSLAIGRLTWMTALLSLLRVDRPLSLWIPGKRTAALLVLALLTASILAIPRNRAREASAGSGQAVSFNFLERGGRVLWIGIDGLGLRFFRALGDDRQLPHLSQMAHRGCLVRLSRFPAPPPAIWVTAATGFEPERHGVGSVESAVFPGIETPLAASPWTAPLFHAARVLNPWVRRVGEVPLSGLQRRDKMIWEILADKGLPSMVVNWWATWPAEEGPGIRISERALFRLEAGGAPDREVFPPEELDHLKAAFSRLMPDFTLAGRSREPGEHEEGVLMDAFHLAQAREGWLRGRWPLVAVYLNGTDLVATPPSGAEDKTTSMMRDRHLVEHLNDLDASLTEMAGAASAADFVLIEGDPGRGVSSEDDSGFILLTGPGVPSRTGLSASLLDVTPTLLRLLGFPRSKEMTGAPLAECMDPSSPIGIETPAPIASYGPRKAPLGGRSEFDPEVLKKLRSLGYIR